MHFEQVLLTVDARYLLFIPKFVVILIRLHYRSLVGGQQLRQRSEFHTVFSVKMKPVLLPKSSLAHSNGDAAIRMKGSRVAALPALKIAGRRFETSIVKKRHLNFLGSIFLVEKRHAAARAFGKANLQAAFRK